MKKLFPLAVIATVAIFSFMPSCKKSDSSQTCTCKIKVSATKDTTYTVPGVTAAQCKTDDSLIKMIDSTGSCTMQ